MNVRTPLERWLDRVDKSETCWLWTGRRNANGYGTFDLGYGSVLAHRFGYEAFVGPIPDSLPLDHLCRVHHCVRPAHLEPVSHRENNLRGFWGQREACKSGHPYVEGSYRLAPGKYGYQVRRCRICERESQARYQARKRAAH